MTDTITPDNVCIRFVPKETSSTEKIQIPKDVRTSLVEFLDASPLVSVRKTAYQENPDVRRRSGLTAKSGYFSLLLDVNPNIDIGAAIDSFVNELPAEAGFAELTRT